MGDENNPVFSGYDRYFQIEKQYPTPISKTVVQSTVNEAEDIAQAQDKLEAQSTCTWSGIGRNVLRTK